MEWLGNNVSQWVMGGFFGYFIDLEGITASRALEYFLVGKSVGVWTDADLKT